MGEEEGSGDSSGESEVEDSITWVRRRVVEIVVVNRRWRTASHG